MIVPATVYVDTGAAVGFVVEDPVNILPNRFVPRTNTGVLALYKVTPGPKVPTPTGNGGDPPLIPPDPPVALIRGPKDDVPPGVPDAPAGPKLPPPPPPPTTITLT
jgi:hypothetical protein